jgi:hypothetical protein
MLKPFRSDPVMSDRLFADPRKSRNPGQATATSNPAAVMIVPPPSGESRIGYFTE